MKIVGQNKSKSWKLHVVKDSSGNVIDVMVGYVNYKDGWQSQHIKNGYTTFEDVDNFVFETRMRVQEGVTRGQSSVKFSLIDADDLPYKVSVWTDDGPKMVNTRTWICGASAMSSIVIALQNGTHKIVDGWIEGKWTFAKQGSEIYVFPYVK